MSLQNKFDDKADTFFQKHGLTYVKTANIIAATAGPVILFSMYRFGSKALPNDGYEVTFTLPVILYALLCIGLFNRYSKRFERRTNTFSLWSVGVSLSASIVIMLSSFPGGPLSQYWHIPGQPLTNIICGAPVVLGLIAALVMLLVQRRKPTVKL